MEEKKNLISLKMMRFFPWKSIFVCGYGAGRSEEGTEDYGKYFAVDAVYTLFKYTQPLQNPELAWRRLLDHARRYPGPQKADEAERAANDWVCDILSKVLMLKKDYKISLAIAEIEGRRGDKWGETSPPSPMIAYFSSCSLSPHRCQQRQLLVSGRVSSIHSEIVKEEVSTFLPELYG